MIQAILRMDFAPEKVTEAVSILNSIVERIRASKGCITCTVYREAGNDRTVVFEEKWTCNKDLQFHLRSEDYQKILMVMEMAHTCPELRFETISDIGGVEIIEEARSQVEK
jgi:quinol monooxygenase YgiN